MNMETSSRLCYSECVSHGKLCTRMFFSSHFILKGNTFYPAMIFCPLLHLVFFSPSLLGNQTQMLPGTAQTPAAFYSPFVTQMHRLRLRKCMTGSPSSLVGLFKCISLQWAQIRSALIENVNMIHCVSVLIFSYLIYKMSVCGRRAGNIPVCLSCASIQQVNIRPG